MNMHKSLAEAIKMVKEWTGKSLVVWLFTENLCSHTLRNPKMFAVRCFDARIAKATATLEFIFIFYLLYLYFIYYLR